MPEQDDHFKYLSDRLSALARMFLWIASSRQAAGVQERLFSVITTGRTVLFWATLTQEETNFTTRSAPTGLTANRRSFSRISTVHAAQR